MIKIPKNILISVKKNTRIIYVRAKFNLPAIYTGFAVGIFYIKWIILKGSLSLTTWSILLPPFKWFGIAFTIISWVISFLSIGLFVFIVTPPPPFKKFNWTIFFFL